MKETNMNFTEALAAMERGEKVRQEKWNKGCYIEKTNMGFYDNDGIVVCMFTDREVCATDWCIYRDKPVLNPCGCGGKAKMTIEKAFDGKECFVVKCKECGVRTAYCNYESAAINDWNYAHPVAKPKAMTNFEKWATPHNVSRMIKEAKNLTTCFKCPCFLHCPHSASDCENVFCKWANAPAEEVKE